MATGVCLGAAVMMEGNAVDEVGDDEEKERAREECDATDELSQRRRTASVLMLSKDRKLQRAPLRMPFRLQVPPSPRIPEDANCCCYAVTTASRNMKA